MATARRGGPLLQQVRAFLPKWIDYVRKVTLHPFTIEAIKPGVRGKMRGFQARLISQYEAADSMLVWFAEGAEGGVDMVVPSSSTPRARGSGSTRRCS